MNTFKLIIKVFSLIIFLNSFAFAKVAQKDFELGAGVNAYTGGRSVPSLEVAYKTSDEVFSWAATGVRSKYYYQSSHLLFYFRTWEAGSMWGGDVTAGFGGGAGYSVRGFQDEGSTTESKTTDYLLGPAIRLNWSYGPFYLNLSTVFGLRDLQKHLLGLNFQNVESLTLGCRF